LFSEEVLTTPFRNMIIPPPMCAYSLQLPAPVSQVVPSSSGAFENDIVVLLCDDRIALFRLEGEKKFAKSAYFVQFE